MSVLRRFREDGNLPNLTPGQPPELPEPLDTTSLFERERQALLKQLLQYPFVYDKYRRLTLVDPQLPQSTEFLEEIAMNVRELAERQCEWGCAALCSRQRVEPECEGEALFALGWFFPNHISTTGANLRHQYEHWFPSSLEVANYLLENAHQLRERTQALVEAIYGSSLPPEVADAISAQCSTLIKCTWWTKAGHFGVWEGLGCCGFHTTDITYQGSFPIISLFPDLQKMQMSHGATFQRADGRVHHLFSPDFSMVDNGFDRVDMNPQFVMLVARDYLWSGDRDYLQRLYPHVVRAMESTLQMDTDGDALPDSDTGRNTYDVWDFQGSPSYICSLWLGALKSAVRLAQEVGDADRATAWRTLYDRGVQSFIRELWNGEYFVLWRDGELVDECCMSDQISADWFFAVNGWEPVIPEDYIDPALDAIMRHTFRPGEGLRNASYPPGKAHRLAASGNLQADALWTGIEYTVAALLIARGRVPEGMAIVRDIHDRHLRAGRFWNHVECGDHYYRAMSAWTLLNALTGFAWDAPRAEMTIAPRIRAPESRYPFFTPLGWGIYTGIDNAKSSRARIALKEGEMRLHTVRLPHWRGSRPVTVKMNDQALRVQVTPDGQGIAIHLPTATSLTKGHEMTIEG